MEFFDFKEICEKADCLAIAKHLGMDEVKPGRFNVPWRPGSDSGALAINRDGWFDHVQNEKGSVIELVSRVKFSGDIQQAQQWLGHHLNLPSKKKTTAQKKLVHVYDYINLKGETIHHVLKYDPKSFRQARPDPCPFGEKFIFDLEGVTPILYRMADWHSKKFVCVVEGEKDADTLCDLGVPATTCSGGAKSWSTDYNEHFRGMSVLILPDNDEPGQEHASIVANNLHGIASEIRILTLSKAQKGDVTDWIGKEGGSKDKLYELAGKVPMWTPVIDMDNEEVRLAVAKRANETVFQNFNERWEEDDKGKEKLVKTPRAAQELLKDMRTRLLGAPYRIGEALFDRDRDENKICYINNPAELFAWTALKMKNVPLWANSTGMLTKQEFFSVVHREAEVFQSISYVPDFPKRDDVYYMTAELPPPHPKHQFLRNFVDRFGPETLEDRDGIMVFTVTALYYLYGVPRPAWVIDSRDGQGCGKTTIPEALAYLFGGSSEASEVITIPYRSLERGTDEITKRLISSTGRQRRFALIDNVQGVFDSPELAEMITSRSISGRAPYGRGEESRPNNLTFVMTMNTATLGRDIAERSIFLHLKRRPYDPHWKEALYADIRNYRLHIMADALDILKSELSYDLPTCTRFPEYERAVIQRVINDPERYSAFMKLQAERRGESDSDQDSSAVVRSVIEEEMVKLGISPMDGAAFIRSDTMTLWMRQVWPDWGHNRIIQTVRNHSKNKLLPQIKDKPRIYPHRGPNRRNGFMWIGENCDAGSSVTCRIIAVNSEGRIKIL